MVQSEAYVDHKLGLLLGLRNWKVCAIPSPSPLAQTGYRKILGTTRLLQICSLNLPQDVPFDPDTLHFIFNIRSLCIIRQLFAVKELVVWLWALTITKS